MNTTSFAVATLFAATSFAPAMAQPTIERLAPENTVFLFGTKNFGTVRQNIEQTPLWSLWKSEQMVKLREDAVKKSGEDIDEMLDELGVDRDSLVWPDGALGFAMFTVRDPELGTPIPAFLALADYGDADKAEKTSTILMAALKRGEEEQDIEFEENEVNGRTVFTVDFSNLKPQDEEDDFDNFGMPMPDPTEIVEGLSKVHFVRDGSRFMFATDIDALTDAIERSDEAMGGAARLADRNDFQAVMSRIGESDAYAVLLTRDVMDIVAASDPFGMMQMMRPMLRTLFGEVQGYGFGMEVDGSAAMVEQTMYIHMPNGKAGLTQLADHPAPRGTLPPFVQPNAVSFTNVTFDFSGLMDVIRRVVMSNPMLAQQMGPQLDTMAPVVNQITATLGNQVYMTTSATRPYQLSNVHSLTAIECTNPQEFENLLSGFAAQMGVEARDFLGQRIYTMQGDMLGMMMPMPVEAESMSLGIGAGYVLLGETAAVEQGLRSLGEAAAAGALATSVEYQRTVSTLANEPVVAWGYSNTLDVMEAMLAVQRESMEEMFREMREEWPEEDMDEDMADWHAEWEAEMRENMKMWDAIDFPLLRRYIGSSAWQVTSTDEGFMVRANLLGASE